MIETGVSGVEFIAINTDLQALARFEGVADSLNIGKEVTRGLGAGGIPDNGRKAAEESRAEIMKLVAGSDLVFVTAGMGGGTGSGAAPIVAEIAREAGALTVGVVTKPFGFEGRRRMQQALEAIESLRGVVDTLIIVSNDRLLQIIPENTPLQRAFSVADDVLRQGVVGISEIIIRPGLINVDFADVRTIMGDAGTALMGIGRGSGKSRAQEAAAAAISSPLLDFPIEKAKGVVFNIVGGNDLTLQEVSMCSFIILLSVVHGVWCGMCGQRLCVWPDPEQTSTHLWTHASFSKYLHVCIYLSYFVADTLLPLMYFAAAPDQRRCRSHLRGSRSQREHHLRCARRRVDERRDRDYRHCYWLPGSRHQRGWSRSSYCSSGRRYQGSIEACCEASSSKARCS
jgi:cell division protein FtsZ